MRLTQPDKGWSWMVLFGAFWIMFVEGAFMGALGIVHLSFLERYNESNMKTSIAGSVFACLNSSGGIITSTLVERFSCRIVTVTGSLLFTAGLIICAFPISLEMVIVAFGILAGIGSSLSNTTAFFAVGYNFKHRMNLASGISTSGIALGSLVMPPVVDMIRTYYGNRMYFVILGGLTLHQSVLGALYFPSYLEHSKKHASSIQSKKSTLAKTVCSKWSAMLKNPSFLYFVGYLCMMQVGAFIMYLHFAKFVTTLGYTSLQASFLLTIKGLCAFFARLLLAGMVNSNSYNVDLTTMMFGTSSFMALASILLPFYGTTFTGLVIFCVFGGLYSDSVFAILNALNVEIVGLDQFALATGIEFAVIGIGIFFGPTIVGKVIDLGGTYTLCFSITGILILIGGILCLMSGVYKSKGNTEALQHKNHDIDVIVDHDNAKSAESIHSREVNILLVESENLLEHKPTS